MDEGKLAHIVSSAISKSRAGLSTHWRTIVLLAIPAMIFLLVQSVYVQLPVVGIHSWDESSYIIIEDHMLSSGDPFAFYQRFDPAGPEYNDRYAYYWSAWVFLEAAQFVGFDVAGDLPTYLRVFSIALTLASYVLIYVFVRRFLEADGDEVKKVVPLAVAAFFLFTPLVLWFGGKAKIEPFGFFLHLVLLLLILDYIRYDRSRSLYWAALLLGVMVVSRSPFLVIGGAYFLLLLIYPRLMRLKDLGICVSLSLTGLFVPVVAVQAIKPDINAVGILINKLTIGSVSQAGSTPHVETLVVRLIEFSIFSTIGIAIFIIFIAFLASRGKLSAELALFAIPGLLYLGLTYRHNIIHMYHSYYYIIPVLLGLGVTLQYLAKHLDGLLGNLRVIRGRAKVVASHAVILALVTILIIPGLGMFVTFYGSTTDYSLKGVYLKDPGGNADSVVAGTLIRKVSESIDLPYGYNLFPEPVTGLYSHEPFIGYGFFYKWNYTLKAYDRSYDYFRDPAGFVSALRNESMVFIVAFPGVFDYDKGRPFGLYLESEYVSLGGVGGYHVYVNKSLDVAAIKVAWSEAKSNLTPEETKLPATLLASRYGIRNN